MIINLTDPASIAAWRLVAPQRHDDYLRWAWKRYPAFRWAIEQSRKAIGSAA